MEYISTKEGVKGIVIDTYKLSGCKRFMQIFSSQPPSFVCFYNPHPLNPFIARSVKRNFVNVILSLYLHDPYKPNKSPYGLAKKAYIQIVEFVQGLTIKYMDYVISPSKYSSHLFRTKYPNFKGENYIAPLLVPDHRVLENENRKYFSMVGVAHPATGHDTFIKLINYVAEKGLNYEFALISSSNVSSYIEKLSNQAQKILKVVNKQIVTDSEINKIVRESYGVFRLDREVTQSGVIPVSYMNETPIIARDIPGLAQHVKHRESGYLVPFNCAPENLIRAMEFVKTNFPELSKNARKSYEKIWAGCNWDRYYGSLMEVLTC